MGLVLNFTVEDGLKLDCIFSNTAIFRVDVQDAFNMLGDLLGDGEPYVVLCLDTEGLRPSIHSLPFFNSLCEVDGVVYGTTPEGVHRLGGDTDNGEPIHTGVAWLKTSFGISNKKKFRAAILEGDVDSVAVQAKTETGSALYPVRRNRVPMGRNLIGRDWDIRIVDFDRLEAVEFVPVVGRR
ncbi:MAG: hypothetical protein JEZ12_13040 [Desulfobacterium sp.]|nr:hypothetical protein [Desulfobacterium sp.]